MNSTKLSTVRCSFTTSHSESLGSKSARASRLLVPFGGRCSYQYNKSPKNSTSPTNLPSANSSNVAAASPQPYSAENKQKKVELHLWNSTFIIMHYSLQSWFLLHSAQWASSFCSRLSQKLWIMNYELFVRAPMTSWCRTTRTWCIWIVATELTNDSHYYINQCR